MINIPKTSKNYFLSFPAICDEARVASQLISIDLWETLNPLSTNLGYSQGFLFIEKISILLFGNTEYALRLFPLLSGIAALLIFVFVTKHILDRKARFIALLIYSISFELIYFSCEVKYHHQRWWLG